MVRRHIEAAREEGYKKGYIAGLKDGFKQGRKEGIKHALELWKEEAHPSYMESWYRFHTAIITALTAELEK